MANVAAIPAEGQILVNAEYLPHPLHGDRKGQWECHIQPDWLLIWQLPTTLGSVLGRAKRQSRVAHYLQRL